MDADGVIHDLFFNQRYNNLNSLLDRVSSIYHESFQSNEVVTSNFVDKSFISEIRTLTLRGDVKLFFGKTLRDLKCVIRDIADREAWAITQYTDQSKIRIISTSLPHATFQDQDFCSLDEFVRAFKAHVASLTDYFTELEKIDRFCSVVDPVKASFKEDYRKIVLSDRVWLHVEVTPEGAATNVHLIGHSELHSAQLQDGLISWDHDRDIVENIMVIFDLVNFLQEAARPTADLVPAPAQPVQIQCGICLCAESEGTAVPQPLCPRERCGAYFHRDCLFAWLVASAGGRNPPLGVASGYCPGCFEPLTCAEKDN